MKTLAIMTEQERIVQLREELHRHNHLYYIDNNPQLSDQEFDALMRELQELEAKHPELYDANSPSQRVGSDLSNEFQTVRHKRPMLSLANTYNEQEVREFYQRVSDGLGGEPFEICCELKFDGLSISLHYEHGELIRAVTRGDGEKGDDVTANVRTIRTIPLRLQPGGDWPQEFEIRGEVLMPWASFDRLNAEREAAGEQLFANPRNAASGTLKSKTTDKVAQRGLDSYLYFLLGDELPADGHYENLQHARQWGFQVSQDIIKAKTLDEVMAFIHKWDVARKQLPVATDGIVLKVNSLRQQRTLGMTAKSPRWAIAYKFQAEQASTRLREVTFQVGRTGAITPVANMDAVLLSGTMVRRATLHNADVLEQLDLHIGDNVLVEKGGEIIPKIVGVDMDNLPLLRGPRVEFIKTCPECGAMLVRFEGEAAFYCPNEAGCPPQIKGKIEHFCSRRAMNIDSIGSETVEDFFSKGLIRNVADLYDLTLNRILDLGRGYKTRSAMNIIEGIERSKQVPFERVLFALGIRFVGETTAKLLASRFRNIDALAAATTEQLLDTNGIGAVIAESIQAWFADLNNIFILDRLRSHGLQFALSEEAQALQSDRLAGQSIVISGVFTHHSRDEYKRIIEQHGGKNVGSISAKTSFILAGDNMGPAKLEKAQKLDIPILNEEEFLKRIE